MLGQRLPIASLLVLASALSCVVAAPIPDAALLARQNHGTGVGCDAILSDFDTSTGEGVESAEENTAGLLSKGKGTRYRRQNAGTGSACYSIFDNTDTSTGLAVEYAEDNTASLISGGKYGGNPNTGGTGPHRRQLNKWADGADQVISAAGDPDMGNTVSTVGDAVDGDLTDDLAAEGEQVGQLEMDTFPTIGKAIPKRQENKWGAGAGDIIDAAGAPQLGETVSTLTDAQDGDETDDLAAEGQQVGQLEMDTFPTIGKAIPK